MADGSPGPSTEPIARSARPYRYDWPGITPFVLCHLALFGMLWSGVTRQILVYAFVLYVVRMFGVTGGYHRYFAHRTFQTSRVFQFFLAFLAQSSAQKGALWWASHHRAHHLHSDTPRDLHSPKQDGVVHAHVGWMFVKGSEATDWKRIKDLEEYPELVFLDRHPLLPAWILGIGSVLALGWAGLFGGFFLSTVLLWHGTFTINSLCHVWGKPRFVTSDTSKNNFWLALVTLGEGWHNNHHHYMRSARQGFYWWEVDVTYYVLWALAAVGVVWDVQEPPARVLEAGRAADRARRAARRDTRRPVGRPSSAELPALARAESRPA